MRLGSESSSHDVVESFRLIGKLRTLIGDFLDDADDVGDGTVSLLLLYVVDGMLTFRDVGDESDVVARIFSGGGLQSVSQLLPLFFRLFCISNLTPALIN